MSEMSSLYEGGESEAQSTETVDEEAAESPSALLPKTILGGKKFEVGDEVVLRIKADHGDEVEVEYAPEKPEGEGESESGASELDRMDRETPSY